MESKIDTLTNETNNKIAEINEKLSTAHKTRVICNDQLSLTFSKILSMQDQLNEIIKSLDYTSDINSINDSLTGLFDKLLILNNVIQVHTVLFEMKYTLFKDIFVGL